MDFNVKINLGNDAMLSYDDVAAALRKLADRLAGDEPVTERGRGPIFDSNGNRVGYWEAER